jgi:membrane fusion protein (multidrug efflux system)
LNDKLRSWLLLPALAALGLALVTGCGGPGGDGERSGGGPGGRRAGFSKGKGAGGPRPEAAVPVVVTLPARGDMEAFLDGSATLEAEVNVEVVSEATGVVAEILAEAGDPFQRGRTLARLAYQELELAEQRARSELERLRANYARAEKLSGEELITEEDYQTVQFDLARAEIDWQQASLELKRTRIVAPITGTVTERMINVGDLVQKNQAVYRVVDFDSLVAPVHIPEKQLVNLHVGQRALLLPPALSGREVPARIKRIAPVVDSQSGTVEVILEMTRSAELRPGMFANARIVLDRHDDVVVLPKKALVYEDEQPHVFVVEQGRAYKRRVELGYQDETRVEVTSGIDEEIFVVLVGQSTLKDGSLIRAEDEQGQPVDTGGDEPGAEVAAGGPPGGEGPAVRGKRP